MPRFLEAARIDSNFLTPVIWAAAAYGNAGNLAAADSLVRVVALSRERLLPADRSLLDYWIAVLGGHLEAALDAARVKALTGPKSPGRRWSMAARR